MMWLGKINQAITETERKGIVAEKITVDPDAFMEWCRVNGKPICRNTRTEYAAGQLMAHRHPTEAVVAPCSTGPDSSVLQARRPLFQGLGASVAPCSPCSTAER